MFLEKKIFMLAGILSIGRETWFEFAFLNQNPPQDVQFVLVGPKGNSFLEAELNDSIYHVTYTVDSPGMYVINIKVETVLETSINVTAVTVSLTFRNVNYF